jgi:hypothetical protein
MDALLINRLFSNVRHDYWAIVPLWALVFAATQLADVALIGPLNYWNPPEGRLLAHTGFQLFFLLSGFFAITSWARYNESQGARTDLEHLRPLLTLTDTDYDALVRRITCTDRLPLRACGIGIAALATSVVFLSPPTNPVHPSDLYIHLAVVPLLGWLSGTSVACRRHQDRVFTELRSNLQPVSPFTPEAYQPFVKRGMRRAIELLIGAMLLGPIIVLLSTPWPALMTVLFLWTLAAAYVIGPVLAVRRDIRLAKTSALSQTRLALAEQAKQILIDGSATANTRIAGLMSVHSYVASVSEWPLDLDDAVKFVRASGLAALSTIFTQRVSTWVGTLG